VYSIVRSDLSIEDQIVQSAHSALEAGREFGIPDTDSNLILLEAKSQFDLLRLSQELNAANVRFQLFYEEDDDIGFTSLTTEPLHYTEQRKLFSKFKLFKFRPEAAFSISDIKETS
jgi:hypothetical protein